MTAFETLVDPATLHGRLGDPTWVVVDCRFSLTDPGWGRRAYAEGHIPGARYAHLDEDLAGTVTPQTGRHPLPEPEAMAARLEAWGVGDGVQLVAYDDAGGAMAARLWWLARWLGHRPAAVLDGGLPGWLRLALRLETTVPRPEPARLTRSPDDASWVGVEAVAAGEGVLLDARAAPRFRGEVEPIDAVAGHVPGAVNAPLDRNLIGEGRFRDRDWLRRRFEALLGGRRPEEAVHMCGSGVTACHNLLAMEVAGLTGSRLYPGSWSEWIRDPSRPVATGPG